MRLKLLYESTALDIDDTEIATQDRIVTYNVPKGRKFILTGMRKLFKDGVQVKAPADHYSPASENLEDKMVWQGPAFFGNWLKYTGELRGVFVFDTKVELARAIEQSERVNGPIREGLFVLRGEEYEYLIHSLKIEPAQ